MHTCFSSKAKIAFGNPGATTCLRGGRLGAKERRISQMCQGHQLTISHVQTSLMKWHALQISNKIMIEKYIIQKIWTYHHNNIGPIIITHFLKWRNKYELDIISRRTNTNNLSPPSRFHISLGNRSAYISPRCPNYGLVSISWVISYNRDWYRPLWGFSNHKTKVFWILYIRIYYTDNDAFEWDIMDRYACVHNIADNKKNTMWT